MYNGVDRRRYERVMLSVPIQMKRVDEDNKEAAEGIVVNISAVGACCRVMDVDVSPNDELRVSVTVPLKARRLFPFSRLVGRARVIRVKEVDEGLRETALEFREDMERLWMTS